MTKSITIAYNEDDENLLLALFRKLKITVLQNREFDFGDEGVPAHVVTDIVDGLAWIKKVESGEVEGITWEQMMAELESEEEAVAA